MNNTSAHHPLLTTGAFEGNSRTPIYKWFWSRLWVDMAGQINYGIAKESGGP